MEARKTERLRLLPRFCGVPSLFCDAISRDLHSCAVRAVTAVDENLLSGMRTDHLVGYYDASGALQDVIPNHLLQAGFPISDGAGDFV